jgi:hypothetical protein
MFTKLQQWLCAIAIYISFWMAAYFEKLPLPLSAEWKEIIFAVST